MKRLLALILSALFQLTSCAAPTVGPDSNEPPELLPATDQTTEAVTTEATTAGESHQSSATTLSAEGNPIEATTPAATTASVSTIESETSSQPSAEHSAEGVTTQASAAASDETTVSEVASGGYWPVIKYQGNCYIYGEIGNGYFATIEFPNSTEQILDDIGAAQSDLLDSFDFAEYIGSSLNHVTNDELADAPDLSVNDKSSTLTFYGNYELYMTDEGLLMLRIYTPDDTPDKSYPSDILIANLWKQQ